MWSMLGDGPLGNRVPDAVDPAPPLLAHLAGEDEGVLGWQERALWAQTDPEAFFPEKGGSTREAKRVCSVCEVRAGCLEYALMNDERFGIGGGSLETERRKPKREAK